MGSNEGKGIQRFSQKSHEFMTFTDPDPGINPG
jgi:hypothetical protein